VYPSKRKPVFGPSTTHTVFISAPSFVLQMSMGQRSNVSPDVNTLIQYKYL
jgi:hypothetical protein